MNIPQNRHNPSEPVANQNCSYLAETVSKNFINSPLKLWTQSACTD